MQNIILARKPARWDLKETGHEGEDLFQPVNGIGQFVAVPDICSSDHSGPMKCGEFLHQMISCPLLKD